MDSSYREAVTTVDHAWLRMNRTTNPMVVTSIMTFDRMPDRERMLATLRHKVELFPRFGCRIEQTREGPIWVGVDDFDPADHVIDHVLPEPADRATVRRVIGEQMSQPMRLDRPLWNYHVFENPHDGRVILLGRFHHVIGDGFSLLYMLMSMTDDGPEPTPLIPPEPSAWRRRFPRLRAVARSLRTAGTVLRSTPRRELLGRGREVVEDLARLLLLPDQPDTLLRGRLGVEKHAAWSLPVGLPMVKATGKALGGTVNDVLMAAVAGALRAYLLEEAEDPSGFDMRTVIPVNLRSEKQLARLGNHFGLVFLDLPLGIEDPVERFRAVKARMDRIKRSPEALVLMQIMRLVGAAPGWVEDLVVDILGAKSTAVMTNVPGPRQTRYFGGEPIKAIMGWVPSSGEVGIGISVFSYDGEVRLGLATDAGLVPQPERILDRFPDALRELAKLADVELEPPREPSPPPTPQPSA
jgi:diacylglycerol O-acyltransferase